MNAKALFEGAGRQLAADRKKAAVLGVLLFVLLVVVLRALFAGGGPEATEAGVAVRPPTTSAAPRRLTRPTPVPTYVGTGTKVDVGLPRPGRSARVRSVSVAGMPRTLARDLFTTQSWHKFSAFTPTTQPGADRARDAEDSGWFTRFGWKLAELQRTQSEAREHLSQELAELKLQSTMTGTHTTAYISGPGFDRLVREGDVVSGFSVVRIEDRRVTFEKSGMMAALTMP